MARIRKCRLNWKPSKSEQVVGYRLYWSKGESVTYDSNFLEVGNVTEVYLPEVLKLSPQYDVRVVLGITAVDMHGNESDMAVLPAPYQTSAPPAPANLLLTPLDEFSVVELDVEAPGQAQTAFPEYSEEEEEELKELARIAKPLLRSVPTEEKVKYYDDVGYRKLKIDWKSVQVDGPIKILQ